MGGLEMIVYVSVSVAVLHFFLGFAYRLSYVSGVIYCFYVGGIIIAAKIFNF